MTWVSKKQHETEVKGAQFCAFASDHCWLSRNSSSFQFYGKGSKLDNSARASNLTEAWTYKIKIRFLNQRSEIVHHNKQALALDLSRLLPLPNCIKCKSGGKTGRLWPSLENGTKLLKLNSTHFVKYSGKHAIKCCTYVMCMYIYIYIYIIPCHFGGAIQLKQL